MTPPPSCPLCAGATHHRFRKNGHEVRGCASCGVLFAASDWSLADARRLYGSDYFDGSAPQGFTDYAGLEHALRRTARERLEHLRPGGRLLDIGCASGTFMAEARSSFRVAGTDVSLSACRTARERGLDVVVADAGMLPFASASHDAVTMWDTIEHLADPLAALREVARILRPGGVLLLSTGDVASWCARLCGRSWHLFNLPEHRFFFSLESLDPLLQRAGLRRTAWRHAGGYYSPAYLLERLIKSLRGELGDRAGVLRSPWLRRTTVYVNLFDIMTVEATRLAA